MARLATGDPAPPFSAVDMNGVPVSLADYRGRPVWLALRRYASCPFCSWRVHRLALEHDQLKEAGVELVVAFPSSRELIDKYARRYQPRFRILSDPELVIYRAYGSEESWLGAARSVPGAASAVIRSGILTGALLDKDGALNRMPSEFLIGPDQVVHRALYGEDFEAGMDTAEVIAWSRSLEAR